MAAAASEGPPESAPLAPLAPPAPEGPADTGGPPPPTGPLRPGGTSGGPQLALLPRGVGEVVDAAIALYRRNWKLLAGTAGVVVVPVQLLSFFANRNLVSQIDYMYRSLQRGVTPVTTTATGSPAGLLGVLVLPFLTVAIATVAASCYLGNPISPGRAWRATMRRFWAILGLGLLRFVLVATGLFFFLAPGIFLSIRLLVAPVALAVEGAGPISALERSWRLTSGQWWRTCGVEVLKVVMVAFAYALVELPTSFLSLLAGPAGWLVFGIGGSLLQVFLAPFLVAVTVVLYIDLRIRREAFDLAVTAQRLHTPSAA